MLRNLKFLELWERDDATTGEDERNDRGYLAATVAHDTGYLNGTFHHNRQIMAEYLDAKD